MSLIGSILIMQEVRVVYDRNTILNTYKQTIREELQKKGDKLHEQLDDVLGF